ncbi:MAG: fasciclin domain-containing protein, partial [Gammaproteobacteria bacterium]|nr:fasciclin domain-containing protein [Gammaproteobacteria bacterium]
HARLAPLIQARGVTVTGARVTAADIAASNGVIHVLDAVVLPPAD